MRTTTTMMMMKPHGKSKVNKKTKKMKKFQ